MSFPVILTLTEVDTPPGAPDDAIMGRGRLSAEDEFRETFSASNTAACGGGCEEPEMLALFSPNGELYALTMPSLDLHK